MTSHGLRTRDIPRLLPILLLASAAACGPSERDPDGTPASAASGPGGTVASDGSAATQSGTGSTSGVIPAESAGSPATTATWSRLGPRRVLAEPLDATWMRGGAHDDSLLMYPMSLAADSSRVLVFDAGSSSLSAYAATDGALLWRVGRRGGGPGEFGSHVAVSVTPGGDVLTLDRTNKRLTFYDAASGALIRVNPWRDQSAPHYACAGRTGTVLALTTHPREPLVWMPDSGGASGARGGWPWNEMEGQPFVLTQSHLVNGPAGDCILAVLYGQGFARYSGSRVALVYARPYVEHIGLPEPDIRRVGERGRSISVPAGSPRAANALAVSDAEVIVSFGGRTEHRDLLIDRYRLADGAYQSSVLLQRQPTAIAAGGGRLFVLELDGEYPSLASYVLPAASF